MIVRLMGGFGNQLFQYAYARKISLEHGETPVLDISSFSRDSLRNYELDNYMIQGCASKKMKCIICNAAFLFQNKFFRVSLIEKILKMVYEKEEFIYQKNTVQNAYLVGYWQNVKYFAGLKDILQREIVYREPLRDQQKQVIEEMKRENSVALHVRRGDYLNSVQKEIYVNLSKDYYEQAICCLKEQISDVHIYVFSDDIEWCRNEFGQNRMMTFIDYRISENQYTDFELMRNCKHFIIANSTFSWWAAYLGDFETKISIAPKNWFIDKRKNDAIQDALLQDMLLV